MQLLILLCCLLVGVVCCFLCNKVFQRICAKYSINITTVANMRREREPYKMHFLLVNAVLLLQHKAQKCLWRLFAEELPKQALFNLFVAKRLCI